MEKIPDREAVRAEIRKILSEAYSGDRMETYDKVADFGQKLREKYKNYDQYELYHILSGSTLIKAPDNFDFPGEDSVELFIRSL